MQPPPGPNTPLALPTSTTNENPQTFNAAMKVRMRVFVDEQNCSATAEIDSDDSRSWHWVISDSDNPIAVIRLVPPPLPPHEHLTHPETSPQLPEWDWNHEPCVKLTRVAVLPEYRGLGLGRRLVDTALEWATAHAHEIDTAMRNVAGQEGVHLKDGLESWKGLVLVHAQVDVERMYQGLGFVTNESLGRWDEEGIEHVGMFKRITLA
jgi:predicted GNAT family N-acyltransferase